MRPSKDLLTVIRSQLDRSKPDDCRAILNIHTLDDRVKYLI